MKDILKAVVYGGIFAVPLLVLLVVDSYFFPFITGKNFAFRIIVEVALVAWLLLCIIDDTYRPKFSYVIGSFGLLVVVMFFSSLFAIDPHTSFFSNYERMDGYITLIHVFLYTVLVGSVLTTKRHWSFFLHTTLVVALITALKALTQYAENPGYRVDSYLGNAAYLAIYMLFHVFIAFWLLVESRLNLARVAYGLAALTFVFVLFATGTRGTAIGLVAGALVMTIYIAVFGAKFPQFRKVAVGSLALLLVAGAGFYAIKDSVFVQSNQSLSRIANIDLTKDLEVRGTIWGMAWEGVRERPVLGWGMGNFNYVFNEQYDPFLFDQEQWFDRVHNIVLDWLIAGGFLGFFAYIGIFLASFYYLVVVPLRRPDDMSFTVLERGVLLGILVGYFTHNLVVFDNIISYIFFAVFLALIHSRVGTPLSSLSTLKVDTALFNQFVVPVAVVVVAALVYTLHVPGMQAAGDLIKGYRAVGDPAAALVHFEQALDRRSFARQEIVEQISQQAMNVVRNQQIPEEVRQQYVARAEAELRALALDKPGDARVHVFFSSFYRAIGNHEAAMAQANIARELSPRKPSVLLQQGIIAYAQGQLEESRDFFKESYELDTRNLQAKEYYLAVMFRLGEIEAALSLVEPTDLPSFSRNDFLVSAADAAGATDFLISLYEERVKAKPEVDQNWASLAFLYYRAGQNEAAIAVLERAGTVRPNFRTVANCIAENIKAGREPQVGCGGNPN